MNNEDLGLKQILELIEKSSHFVETWNGMIDEKVFEKLNLKRICASYYLMGLREASEVMIKVKKKMAEH